MCVTEQTRWFVRASAPTAVYRIDITPNGSRKGPERREDRLLRERAYVRLGVRKMLCTASCPQIECAPVCPDLVSTKKATVILTGDNCHKCCCTESILHFHTLVCSLIIIIIICSLLFLSRDIDTFGGIYKTTKPRAHSFAVFRS